MKNLFKHLFLAIIFIIAPSCSAFSQNKDVIVMPEFPGGHEAMQEYLLSAMRYPLEAKMNDEMGEVLIGFSVGIDGSIGGVRVLRSVSESLDKEAVRVVQSMPKWKPGSRNGKLVRAELSIPINFAIVRDILDGDNIDTDEKSLKKLDEKRRKKLEKKKEKQRRKEEKRRKKEEKKRKKMAEKLMND